MNGQILEIISKLEKSGKVDRLLEFLFNIITIIIRRLIWKNRSGTILIISLHKLGDTVFTIPAVRKIIDRYSDKKVSLITYCDSGEIYKAVLENANIIYLEKKYFVIGGRLSRNIARKILKGQKPEIIFDLTGNIASASLVFNSRANTIIGMNSKYFKSIYDVYLPIRNNPHLIERYLDVVKSFLDVNDGETVREFPIHFERDDKILIHPFAGWKAKEWNLHKYIELAGLLNKDYEVEFISPYNMIAEDVIHDIKKNGIEISFTATIKDLMNKIQHCSIFISNDSGPLYIASLLGKPTFSIYGPTNPEYSLPFGKYHRYIQKRIACSPNGVQYCFTHGGLYCPSNECMSLIKVSSVHYLLNAFVIEIGIRKAIRS